MIILSLKAARVNNQLTLIKAAEILGINKDSLCRMEKDASNVPMQLACKMSEVYGVPLTQLYFGDMKQFKQNTNQ